MHVYVLQLLLKRVLGRDALLLDQELRPEPHKRHISSLITWNYSSAVTQIQKTIENHSLKETQNKGYQENTSLRLGTYSKWLHNI